MENGSNISLNFGICRGFRSQLSISLCLLFHWLTIGSVHTWFMIVRYTYGCTYYTRRILKYWMIKWWASDFLTPTSPFGRYHITKYKSVFGIFGIWIVSIIFCEVCECVANTKLQFSIHTEGLRVVDCFSVFLSYQIFSTNVWLNQIWIISAGINFKCAQLELISNVPTT